MGLTSEPAISICSFGVVTTYIRDGILPVTAIDPGTVCAVESSSFGNSTFILQKRGFGDDGELDLLEAAEGALHKGLGESMNS